MSETTKNTLLEAKNAALRAELDEAHQKIAKHLMNDRDVAVYKQAVTDHHQRIKKLELQNSKLFASQPTPEQVQKLHDYDKLASALDKCNSELIYNRSSLDTARTKLSESESNISKALSLYKTIKQKNLDLTKKTERFKDWMCLSIGTAAVFVLLAGGGSYFYVESQLTPDENLSAEAFEAFKKHAPEYRDVMLRATAVERSNLQESRAELQREKNAFDLKKPSSFDGFVTSFFIYLGVFVAGMIFLAFILVSLLK